MIIYQIPLTILGCGVLFIIFVVTPHSDGHSFKFSCRNCRNHGSGLNWDNGPDCRKCIDNFTFNDGSFYFCKNCSKCKNNIVLGNCTIKQDTHCEGDTTKISDFGKTIDRDYCDNLDDEELEQFIKSGVEPFIDTTKGPDIPTCITVTVETSKENETECNHLISWILGILLTISLALNLYFLRLRDTGRTLHRYIGTQMRKIQTSLTECLNAILGRSASNSRPDTTYVNNGSHISDVIGCSTAPNGSCCSLEMEDQPNRTRNEENTEIEIKQHLMNHTAEIHGGQHSQDDYDIETDCGDFDTVDVIYTAKMETDSYEQEDFNKINPEM